MTCRKVQHLQYKIQYFPMCCSGEKATYMISDMLLEGIPDNSKHVTPQS